MRTTLALLVLLPACTWLEAPKPDPCGGPNMSNPRLDPGLPVDPDSRRVQITWDVGAILPDEYFAAVVPDAETKHDVASVRLVSARLLEVRLTGAAGSHGNIVLRFPDRRRFSSCSHRGMDDVYLLKGNVRWVGDPPGHLVQSFAEHHRLGPL
jgi:hypothetical protein